MSPLQLGIPYSRPRYFALIKRAPHSGQPAFHLQVRLPKRQNYAKDSFEMNCDRSPAKKGTIQYMNASKPLLWPMQYSLNSLCYCSKKLAPCPNNPIRTGYIIAADACLPVRQAVTACPEWVFGSTCFVDAAVPARWLSLHRPSFPPHAPQTLPRPCRRHLTISHHSGNDSHHSCSTSLHSCRTSPHSCSTSDPSSTSRCASCGEVLRRQDCRAGRDAPRYGSMHTKFWLWYRCRTQPGIQWDRQRQRCHVPP